MAELAAAAAVVELLVAGLAAGCTSAAAAAESVLRMVPASVLEAVMGLLQAGL